MADPVFYDKKLPGNIDVYISDTGKLLQEGDIDEGSEKALNEAGATASQGQPEGHAHAYSEAATAKRVMKHDSYLKIVRERREQMNGAITAQSETEYQSTLTEMEEWRNEEIDGAKTFLDGKWEEEVVGAKVDFDRAEQETIERFRKEEQDERGEVDQMIPMEEDKRDMAKRQRQTKYDAQIAALKQEYDQEGKDAHQQWCVDIDAVREDLKKKKADSARTRTERQHDCLERLKTQFDTSCGGVKERIEAELNVTMKEMEEGRSKNVHDASEKHRESMEEDAKQGRAKEEKIRVEEDAVTVSDNAAWVNDTKQHRWREQLEGPAPAYFEAETAKRAMKRDSVLKIGRERREKTKAVITDQLVSAYQSTRNQIEEWWDGEIAEAKTLAADELEEERVNAHKDFDRAEQETIEHSKKEEQDERGESVQMITMEEDKRDMAKRQRQTKYDAQIAALEQEYLQEKKNADQQWCVHIDAVREALEKKKADSDHTRPEQQHGCLERLKTQFDTTCGVIKERMEAELNVMTKKIDDRHSKKVHDASEKHRESLEEDVKQRRAKEEKIRVEEDAVTVSNMAAWVHKKKQRCSGVAATGGAVGPAELSGAGGSSVTGGAAGPVGPARGGASTSQDYVSAGRILHERDRTAATGGGAPASEGEARCRSADGPATGGEAPASGDEARGGSADGPATGGEAPASGDEARGGSTDGPVTGEWGASE